MSLPVVPKLTLQQPRLRLANVPMKVLSCDYLAVTVAYLQDLGGLRMSMLNANTLSVFKAMSAIYQDHYPVSRNAVPSIPAEPRPSKRQSKRCFLEPTC